MALDADQELLEHLWKVEAMRADVELKKAQSYWEPWKVITTAALASAALVGAGVTVGTYLQPRSQSLPPVVNNYYYSTPAPAAPGADTRGH